MAAEMEERVGDSSRNRLANFQRCAREILRSMLAQKNAADSQMTVIDKRLSKQVDLTRRREVLLKKQVEANVELELRSQLSDEPLGSVSVSDDDAYVDSIRQRLKGLEEELLTVKTDHIHNCKLLECLHQGNVLREKVFGNERRDLLCSLDDSNDNDSELAEQLTKQSELSEELLSEVEQMEKIRSELTALRRERTQLQQQSRTLMEYVQSSMKSQTSADSTSNSVQEDSNASGSGQLHHAENQVCLLRHTLQGLIVGSGVPWSQDKELLELTLKLGDDEECLTVVRVGAH